MAAHGLLDTQELSAACFKTLQMEVENSLQTPAKAYITLQIVEGHGIKEDNQKIYCNEKETITIQDRINFSCFRHHHGYLGDLFFRISFT